MVVITEDGKQREVIFDRDVKLHYGGLVSAAAHLTRACDKMRAGGSGYDHIVIAEQKLRDLIQLLGPGPRRRHRRVR